MPNLRNLISVTACPHRQFCVKIWVDKKNNFPVHHLLDRTLALRPRKVRSLCLEVRTRQVGLHLRYSCFDSILPLSKNQLSCLHGRPHCPGMFECLWFFLAVRLAGNLLNDMFDFDPATSTWRAHARVGTTPAARSSFGLAFSSGSLYLFGGQTLSGTSGGKNV